MRDWSKIAPETVFTGKSEDGNRYLNEFLRDYKTAFNPAIIEAGCRRCLNDYYSKLTQSLHKMKTVKTAYKLKAKYNGIPLKFGSRIQVSNTNLTDALAEELIKNHPRGADLFEIVPEAKEVTVKSLMEDHTRAELNAKAKDLGFDTTTLKSKRDVAKAILAH